MPRWPAKKSTKAKSPKKRRRNNTPGVVDDIPTISRSSLRSSISPRSSSDYAERAIEVERGTTLIIKIV